MRGEVKASRIMASAFSSEGVLTASRSTEDCLEVDDRVRDGDREVLSAVVDECAVLGDASSFFPLADAQRRGWVGAEAWAEVEGAGDG